MSRSPIVNNMITGVTVGVLAGLILAVFSCGQQYVDQKRERSEQIRYIRQIVEAFQEDILSAQQVLSEPSTPPSLANIPDALRKLRWAHLEYTHGEIVKTLDSRASTLTFDEKEQLLDAFSLYNLLRPGGDFGDRGFLLDEVGYHAIFDELEAIKWLNVKIVDRTALEPRPS